MTVPLPGTTVSNNYTSNMYYEFHVPLGVYNAIRKLLVQQQNSPNSPAPITDASQGREWFSQPRPAQQGTAPKPTFYYAIGTSRVFDVFGKGVLSIPGGDPVPIPGLDGQVLLWNGDPATDPFPRMIDQRYWNVRNIEYAAAIFPGMQSINEGAKRVCDMIDDTPGDFGLGGYSQGGAVMSLVYKEIQNGRLKHRRKNLIAATVFGNPCRQAGHLWPGATPIGSFDDPDNMMSHGVFPADMRLNASEELWWDFANESEPSSTVGDSELGTNFTNLTGLVTRGFDGKDLMKFIKDNISKLPWDVVGETIEALEAVGAAVADHGPGKGHGGYATLVPPGDPRNGMTSYQIALEHLRDVGRQYEATRRFNQQTEVLQVNFKELLPINDISFQAVKVPAQIEMWYLDRQQNWREILDENRSPATLILQSSPEESWFPHHVYTAPTVTKSVQFRITRLPDTTMGTRPYCVGLRNILMRRNIYDRPSGIRATTIVEDIMGNVVETYIKDWDAPKAIDNNPSTFWRSAPQPSPDAVVALHLDLRTAEGDPQLIDTLYIDPVYTGSALNIYYTNDETDGVTLEPSPISVSPRVEAHTRWLAGRGLWDVSTGSESSEFTAPLRVGPLVKKNCWIGVEWTPDFVATSPPGTNPVLLEIIPSSPEPGQFWPKLYYDVGEMGYGKIVLEFTNGTTAKTFEVPLSPPLIQGEPIRIVAGWAYDAPGSAVYISVKSKGVELGNIYVPNTTQLPNFITLDGEVSFSKFRGLMTAHIIKLTSWINGSDSFMVNPCAYVDPDPIIPDSEGAVTSSNLDNSVFSCDWTAQRYPVGGTTPSMHSEQRWTPIWRDYTVQRGKLFFPRQISCKYLKLEFSKLTPEPYPVYDTGIQVTYETFPVAVYADITTTTTTSTPGADTTITIAGSSTKVHTPGFIENAATGWQTAVGNVTGAINGLLGNINSLTGSIASVNWLDPRSIRAASEAYSVTTSQPVIAAVGTASEAPSIPNTLSTALGQSTGAGADPSSSIALRTEATSSMVARRKPIESNVLAGQAVNQITGQMPNQGLGATTSHPITTAIATAFAPTVSAPNAAPVFPVIGKDFWLFPGGLLKMPAAIMEGLFTGVRWALFGTNATIETPSQTIVTPGAPITTTTSTTQRVRFNTTETHIYRRLVATRSSAIGYFAGIREIGAYNTTYIDYEDALSFDFKVYDPKQWRFDNVKQLTTGAVTTNGSPYTDADLDFYNLDSWDAVGDWEWDGTQDNYSGNRVGSATIEATGTDVSLTSNKPFAVSPEDEVVIAASVKYVDAVSDTGGEVVMEIVTYFEGEEVSVESLDPAPANTPAEGYTPPLGGDATRVAITEPTGKTDGVTFTHLIGTYVVPSDGVDAIAVRFRINSDVTAGRFWIAEAKAEPRNGSRAFLFNRWITFSKFSKIICDFRDSGLRRSDRMWARMDPLNTNIDKSNLAWYTSPTTMPPGMWGDQFAAWADENVKWGNARATVAIWIDPERMYKGNRALHFRRAAGSGSAGVRVIQQTNYFPGAQARICCTFYKPNQNSNYITLRLRRVSDGYYVHEETIPNVPVGQWYTYQTPFFEVPDTLDQVYVAEISLTGTYEDDLYVSDLYTEVAHVRYFMRLGGVSNPNAVNIDVTELAHNQTSDAIVTCTVPTNEVSLEVVLLTPLAVAYGVTLTPMYLQ